MVLKRRLVFLCLFLMIFGAAARAEGLPGDVPVEDYIRLHVLAEDDGDAAQALKLQVRDAVLAAARALLADCDGADAAWTLVGENARALEDAARARARELGFDGDVRAEVGVFDFPERRYGEISVPAGAYRALRVVIGKGEGRNWWCVLYPTLCLTEDCPPGEPAAFHSAIWDWLKGLLGGDEG